MSYFKYFDTIEYEVDGYTKTAVDLLRAVLPDDIDLGDFYIFQRYQVTSGERPESVAYKLYQNANHYWVLLVINNIINPYIDWPMSDEEVEEYTKTKYGPDNIFNVHHYYWLGNPYHKDLSWVDEVDSKDPTILSAQEVIPMTNLEYEIEQNAAKRTIVAVNPRLVSQFADAYNKALKGQTV